MKRFLVTCKTSVCYGHEDIWNFIVEIDTTKVVYFDKYEFVKNYLYENANKFNYNNWTNAGNYNESNSAYISRTKVVKVTEWEDIAVYR